MSLELLGAEEIGSAIGANTVRVYTDAGTVRAVQTFLRGIGGGKAFPIKVDGLLGPETNSAVRKFNTDYRNKPEDREFITDGTLASMSITASGSPAEVIAQPTPPSNGRPAKGWSQPQPGALGPAITPETPESVIAEYDDSSKLFGQPWYVVALAGLAAALLGTGIVVAVSR